MVLTRQGLTPQTRTEEQLEAVKRGAYILKDCEGTPEVILIATGSEVQLAVSAAEALAGKGRKARVVSMPCAELLTRSLPNTRKTCCPAPCVRAWRSKLPPWTVGGSTWGSTRGDRHVRLWRVRPRRRAVQALRVHRRSCR